jgi:argininosuccinate lyase
MQEDKEGVFDALDTVKMCLPVMTAMLDTMTVRTDNMKKAAEGGFIGATDLADYLVCRGLPFRAAYKIAGQLVAYCIREGKTLETLTLSEYQSFSDLIGEDIYGAVDLLTCVRRRTSEGGTSPESVRAQIAMVKELLK